jgi:DNA-binding transcriptional ArsR family regulator
VADRPRVPLDDLTAVHHPVRRRILEHLALHGPDTVGGLAAGLGQQVGSISHHLRVLDRSGFVAAAPELARDRRESWWRGVPRPLSWSVADFADAPADRLLAATAERANLDHHVGKVLAWLAERYGPDGGWSSTWQLAAFSTDSWANATAAELRELGRRLNELVVGWAEDCRAAAAREEELDEADRPERLPAFVFAHGNPSRP